MDPTTVVFFPEQAYGPTNNCVGIGQELLRRGNRVVFVVEESFAGTLEARGFDERVTRLTPPPQTEEAPGQFWTDFIRDTAPIFHRPTIDQLEDFIKPTWQALIDGARYVDDHLEEILAEVRPDVVVEDNVVTFPALLRAGVPWVRITSCNPLEIPDPGLPPVFSGLPTGDPNAWEAFRDAYRRSHADLHASFDAWCRERGCAPLPDLEFIHTSDALNLFLFPAAADYPRERPLGAAWHRIDSCVRDPVEADVDVPLEMLEGDGALIYLSLGSLGSADVELMQRLIDVLATTEHRVIVSMGPLHDQLRLGKRMWGHEFLPQPALLPHADVVVTHGGNNTTTECLHHGKPMVVAPLFWDQHDNAQRIDELGLGVRLDTYGFAAEDLTSAIDRLSNDTALRGRLDAIGEEIRAADGRRRAAELIERIAR